MGNNFVRLLRADEIEVRISQINERGVSLLIFKDARADIRLLNETFGPFGWRRSHQLIGNSLFCTVEVLDKETGIWVAKQDVGTSGTTEPEKTAASDSFKRACTCWSLGVELYSSPRIYIPSDRVKIHKQGERYVTYEQFHVDKIEYSEEREITYLRIMNSSNVVVFEWKKPKKAAQKLEGLSEMQLAQLKREVQRTGVGFGAILQRYNLESVDQMTEEMYADALKGLKRTRGKSVA